VLGEGQVEPGRRRRILFVYNSNEHIGITYLSAALKARGHEVRLAFDPQVFRGEPLVRLPAVMARLDRTNQIVELARSWEADFVCCSCYTDNFRWMLGIAAGVKAARPDCVTVFGGVHVTSVPEAVLEYEQVDVLVRGEAEEALLEVVERTDFAGGGFAVPTDLRNVWMRTPAGPVRNPLRPYIADLDVVPTRDFQLFYDHVPVMEENYLCMGSRGCPYACSYCSVEMYHRNYAEIGDKQRYRRRSVDATIAELKIIKARGRAKTISFMDDVFTVDRRWLDPFLERYRDEIGLPFWCYTYPSGLDDDLVRRIAEAGAWMMTMGVQSGSKTVRRDAMNRRESDDKVLSTAASIQRHGILLSVDKIIGAPGEGPADRSLDLELFRRLRPDRILTFPLTYFPGTDMVRKGLEAGELTADDVRGMDHGHLEQQPPNGRLLAEPRAYRKLGIQMGLIPLLGDREAALEPLVDVLSRLPGSAAIQPALLAANALRIGDSKFTYLLKVLAAGVVPAGRGGQRR
jgi:anaerobic magnesium-protoporphyrin IX monomethyl ester cyclase